MSGPPSNKSGMNFSLSAAICGARGCNKFRVGQPLFSRGFLHRTAIWWLGLFGNNGFTAQLFTIRRWPRYRQLYRTYPMLSTFALIYTTRPLTATMFYFRSGVYQAFDIALSATRWKWLQPGSEPFTCIFFMAAKRDNSNPFQLQMRLLHISSINAVLYRLSLSIIFTENAQNFICIRQISVEGACSLTEILCISLRSRHQTTSDFSGKRL